MNPVDLIENAKKNGRGALNEADSKVLLASFGVPTVKELLASSDPDGAVENAEALGYPVVLKGHGDRLTHKTDLGLVRIGLNSAKEVRQAALEMMNLGQPNLEGWLVQPQIKGRRELVAGMFRDDNFGPVIMFGLGGIYTEALNDVVFRIAPLTEAQAGRMLDEIYSRDLLRSFRGEEAVDRNQLISILTGLSRLSMEFPSVSEVDINPLLISSEGQAIAVDALVMLGDPKGETSERPIVDPASVSALFHPKSVAFVGASRRFRKWGQLLFANVLGGGFEGQVHLVNPSGGTIGGRKVYKSVSEIPGKVDLAVVTIPRTSVFDLIPELTGKGIKGMILITAGFGESGPEGQELEARLVREARNSGLLIMGPNTMGMCNPHEKFYCMGASVRPKPGKAAFISQSGNLGTQLLAFAEAQGIGIRAFAGSGNEAMLTVEDALDYFGGEDLTRVILLYIESVKNGTRFFKSATCISLEKPIVLLKGGRTRAGEQAAASHTGALASDNRVFETACRQAGIITVKRTMDLLDLCAAFSALPLPKGLRVAIMTLGGGWGVVTADLCNEYGLEVPEPTPELIQRLDSYLPTYWSRSNPFDLVGESDTELALMVVEELFKWDGCDAVISLGVTDRASAFERLIESTVKANPETNVEHLNSIKQRIKEFDIVFNMRFSELMEEYQKPILNVSRATSVNDQKNTGPRGKKYSGVSFQTPERAVKVLAKMCSYQDWLQSEKTDY